MELVQVIVHVTGECNFTFGSQHACTAVLAQPGGFVELRSFRRGWMAWRAPENTACKERSMT